MKATIEGILNSSPRRITAPWRVKAITVDIATDLTRLPCYLPDNRR